VTYRGHLTLRVTISEQQKYDVQDKTQERLKPSHGGKALCIRWQDQSQATTVMAGDYAVEVTGVNQKQPLSVYFVSH
jgi:hypothetical protein